MTDQDNLRDRIKQIFYQVGDGVMVLNMSLNERNELAQAIIDEFGLTVELKAERVMTSADPFEFDYTRRVVGKWEKQ